MNTNEILTAIVETRNSAAPAPQPTPPQPVASAPEQDDCRSTDPEVFVQLARLTPADYDHARVLAASELGIRLETLDAEVARCRHHSTTPLLHSPDPWPRPIDGRHGPSAADVLDQVAARFAHYVVLPPGAADALALWTAHAHAFEAFLQTPRLNLYSPDKGCGKTTTLDVLASLTPRPLRTENLTAPVLFRLVDEHQPTLLLDEVDAYLNQAEELRGLLNAGHKRGACAYRCEGERNSVRAFRAFAPAALAGIGALPATLLDRSVAIPLVRAKPGEIPARFNLHRLEIETELARQLARWAQDNFAALSACDPALPAGAFNRLADNWRPLFAIARTAGGGWPERALSAFTNLTSRADHDADGLGVALLADIRQIFTQTNHVRIPSAHLVKALGEMTDRPWPEAFQGRGVTEHWLARHLRPFGINPRTLRFGDSRGKGYDLADFADAFTRFLNPIPQTEALENDPLLANRDIVPTSVNTGSNPLL